MVLDTLSGEKDIKVGQKIMVVPHNKEGFVIEHIQEKRVGVRIVVAEQYHIMLTKDWIVRCLPINIKNGEVVECADVTTTNTKNGINLNIKENPNKIEPTSKPSDGRSIG